MLIRGRHVFGCALAWALLAGCGTSSPAASTDSPECAGAGGACQADSGASTRPDAGSAAIGGRGAGTGAAGTGAAGAGAGARASAGAAGANPAAAAGAGVGAAGAAGSGTAGSPASEADAAMPDASAPSDAACGICAAYAEPTTLATLGVPALDALSGLATSRTTPNVIYAHNDHDRPEIYALNERGQLLLELALTDARATDLEDIAVGACPEGSCIYFADIGDNAAMRASYAILRFPEPELPAAPSSERRQIAAERFEFSYEDGSHNAEGMFVAPDGHAVYVVTKPSSGAASVYRIAEPSTAGMNLAVKVAQLPIPAAADMQTSAAAAHPCGLGFLVRTYNRVYEFRSPAGMQFESALQAAPLVAAMPDEMQSEGIDYLPDGRGFVSSGEGASAPILVTRCK